MNEFMVGMGLALWFGILTSISPCPLATNIAAISYIGRRVDDSRKVFLAGLIYTIGRSIAYLALGMLIVTSLLSAPHISHILQKYMMKILGPLLIIVGMFLLGLLSAGFPGAGTSERVQKRAERMGIWGAGFLGFVFALSFCPVSAALFFGSLIPLAVKSDSQILFPLLYGIGTALPVVVFAALLAAGAHYVGKAFRSITRVELWARRVTGSIFIGTGVYFSLKYIFVLF
jgi:cytochrome c biogenesis protein CcdA